MSIYDDSWGDVKPARRISLEEQRQTGLSVRNNTYVPAQPSKRTAVAYPLNDYPIAPAGENAMQALESVRETATPVQRAYALGIRLIPFTVAWLVLALVLAFLGGDLLIPFLLFAALTAITYYLMNRQEYDYSAAGLERHKAELAADLRELQLKQEHELKRSALAGYLKHLEGGER